MNGNRFTIVGIGEALFDVLPDARLIGGAPLNVATHAHQLAQPHGGRGVIVSRIGQDVLGDELIAELRKRGMTHEFLETDPDHETGQVYVSFDAQNQPSYDIVRNVAWDWLNYDHDVENLARRCEAVCFGTLAQREGQTRNTILRFLDDARRAYKLFDVNLRPPFYDAGILRRSCERATAVKMNEQELPVVVDLLGLQGGDADAQAVSLMRKFEVRQVILTRGAQGTVMYTGTDKHVGEPAHYPAAEGADLVGAGDACAAAILLGAVLRLRPDPVVTLANHAGAFVAANPGATPTLPESILRMAR
jgi:fructokinase